MLEYPLGAGRQITRVISVGSVKMGGLEPIVLQSMLTSSAQNLSKAMEEIRLLDQAGAQLIRLSIPTKKELDAIGPLRQQMAKEGISRPLVADVHFSPSLATACVPWFEKVRINPGNFSDDPKKTTLSSFDLETFSEGREQFLEALRPFADGVVKYQRAVRVGVNQGSLSQRMMARYGDSPLGMVESALETIELLESLGVKELVVSLKSSNPLVVLKAYRLLVQRRSPKEALPLHLGVTEAGDGLMGRIKSLSGIGPLLYDGLGATIRVSLTEASQHEIAFGEQLLGSLQDRLHSSNETTGYWKRPLLHRRASEQASVLGSLELGAQSPVKLFGGPCPDLEFDGHLTKAEGGFLNEEGTLLPLVSKLGNNQKENGPVICDLSSPVMELRTYFAQIDEMSAPVGLLVDQVWLDSLKGKVELSCLLAEGLVDFLVLPELKPENIEPFKLLLQATRTRIYVTDYIACPSCARTLFDLESTTDKIRRKTDHLKGVKIGIMGCIVNGPGEMADADFGYIGSGPGKVDLYRGQDQVSRNIPEVDAVDALIQLIKDSNSWVDP